jgi:hypothetical protein
MTRRWQKFPNFIDYANEDQTFREHTKATSARAWELATCALQYIQKQTSRISSGKKRSGPSVLRVMGSVNVEGWKQEEVWEALADHQQEFRLLLDGVIAGHVHPVHLQWLQKHSGHLRMAPDWAHLSEEIPPDLLRGAGLAYFERLRVHDPLDGLYWELQGFLRLGGEQRLRKCRVCQRHFVQSTSRPQTYCAPACRLEGDPNRREANQEYQRRHRERGIRKDLNAVKEAKARLRAQGETDLALRSVLEAAHLSSRRWTSLRQWEEKHHGRPRVTDLTKP